MLGFAQLYNYYKVLNTSNVSTTISELVKKRSSTYNLWGDNTVYLPRVNSTKCGFKIMEIHCCKIME